MDLNMRTESDRQRATHAFNHMAAYYDQYRPDYPEEIIKTIVNKANLTADAKLLEIGAGSGKATAQFAGQGFEIVCVEPGADLAEQGKTRFKAQENVRFVVARFEDYSVPYDYFDAIVSAQAFHWVSQPLGYEKCARALKKDGYLALFWHLDLSRNVDLDRELVTILNRYDGFVSCMPEEDYGKRMESIADKIVSSGLFTKPEIIHAYLEQNYTANAYFNYMLTSQFAQQPNREKQACREELMKLADKYGGIRRRYTYELYLTQKR